MTESKTDSDSIAKPGKKPPRRKTKSKRMAPATRGETLVKGVVMGLIISNANQAGRSILGALLRHPAAMLSTGFAAGYLMHKYRKEIIVLGNETSAESKNFLLRQKENLLDLVAECQEHAQDRNKSI
jgi:hypothetical protein